MRTELVTTRAAAGPGPGGVAAGPGPDGVAAGPGPDGVAANVAAGTARGYRGEPAHRAPRAAAGLPLQAGRTRGTGLTAWREHYRRGGTVAEMTSLVMASVAERGDDGTWITTANPAALDARAAELASHPDPDSLPLFGVPFAVKDSLDIVGWPTTLACPAYSRLPDRTAPMVTRLCEAGAVLIGKTNLDQFATGLNGTRTGYTLPRSVFGGDLISGGSSSGSALAVALGQVAFAVATDTAGSGRVPPALNGVVGYKPSRGVISAVGLVPACRSLDCVSLVAGSIADITTVLDVVAAMDEEDPWSRALPAAAPPDQLARNEIRVGLSASTELEFFGDELMAQAHLAARERVAGAFPTVPSGLQPFLEAGALLYSGPWVAERWVEFGGFLDEHPGAAVPVVEDIIRSGSTYSAADVFRAQYRLAECKAVVDRIFERFDVLLLPTIGTTFTVPQVLADPVQTNTKLGFYTHFGNLLDLCAAAIPAGMTTDGRPVSLMILGPALSDEKVLHAAGRIERLF